MLAGKGIFLPRTRQSGVGCGSGGRLDVEAFIFKRIALASLCALLLGALLGSSASAQVINGCIKNNGTLKIVADPSRQ